MASEPKPVVLDPFQTIIEVSWNSAAWIHLIRDEAPFAGVGSPAAVDCCLKINGLREDGGEWFGNFWRRSGKYVRYFPIDYENGGNGQDDSWLINLALIRKDYPQWSRIYAEVRGLHFGQVREDEQLDRGTFRIVVYPGGGEWTIPNSGDVFSAMEYSKPPVRPVHSVPSPSVTFVWLGDGGAPTGQQLRDFVFSKRDGRLLQSTQDSI